MTKTHFLARVEHDNFSPARTLWKVVVFGSPSCGFSVPQAWFSGNPGLAFRCGFSASWASGLSSLPRSLRFPPSYLMLRQRSILNLLGLGQQLKGLARFFPRRLSRRAHVAWHGPSHIISVE